jgi:hypothetical protein
MSHSIWEVNPVSKRMNYSVYFLSLTVLVLLKLLTFSPIPLEIIMYLELSL